MNQINLRCPTGSKKERTGWGEWGTVFLYKCSEGHEVRVRASSFRGTTPEPGVGAISCPQCERSEREQRRESK